VALHLNKLPCFTIKEKGVYHPGKQHLGIYCQYSLVTDQGLTPFTQIVISSKIKYAKRVYAFTEQGVAMLSSVLRSKRAVQVNIQIMRAFTQLRQMLSTHEDLKKKIESMEKKYDQQFQVVFEAIKQLIDEESKPKKKIGFTVKEKQKAFGKKTKKKK